MTQNKELRRDRNSNYKQFSSSRVYQSHDYVIVEFCKHQTTDFKERGDEEIIHCMLVSLIWNIDHLILELKSQLSLNLICTKLLGLFTLV